MKKKIPLPIEKRGGNLKYFGNIYIIEQDKNKGNSARYQVNGTACDEKTIKGYIKYRFKSKHKYFSPEYWYDYFTRWYKGNDKIYFLIDKNDSYAYCNEFFNGCPTKATNKYISAAQSKAIPVSEVLKEVQQEVYRKTKLKINFPFDIDNANYERDFVEAYIPILIDDKSYILTWENCD